MKIFENISLRDLNSFGVDVRARRLVEWESASELPDVDFSQKWMALGGGNNVLFVKDFDGTLVKSAAKKIVITGQTEETVEVRAESGVDWDDFVAWCVSHGLWGVENLSAIPGTVGAAPIQNIGAYGAEAQDVISSVECFAVESGATLTLAREHCGFGYRTSVFKTQLRGKVIVTAVNFVLSKEPKPNLKYGALAEKVVEFSGRGQEPTLAAIRKAVTEIRAVKLPDPRTMGNAGSFFKNPVVDEKMAARLVEKYPSMPVYPAEGGIKLAAGWLVEAAGWRGKTTGNVGIHRDQALVVVNFGGATGEEIIHFAQKVQADVEEKFGVELETEVNVVG